MTPMLFFLFFIPLLGIILLSVNFILAPHKPYKEKKTPFECGYHSFLSQTRTQFTIIFFVFTLLFMLLDLEIIIVFPYVVSSYDNQVFGLTLMIIFIVVITVGFIYELGKGALKIKSKQEYILSQAGASKSLYKGRYNTIPKLSEFHSFYSSIILTCIIVLLSLTWLDTSASIEHLDAPRHSALYFQDSTSPQMEALVNLDVVIKFLNILLIIIVVSILILFVNIVIKRISKKSPKQNNKRWSFIKVVGVISLFIVFKLLAIPFVMGIVYFDSYAGSSNVEQGGSNNTDSPVELPEPTDVGSGTGESSSSAGGDSSGPLSGGPEGDDSRDEENLKRKHEDISSEEELEPSKKQLTETHVQESQQFDNDFPQSENLQEDSQEHSESDDSNQDGSNSQEHFESDDSNQNGSSSHEHSENDDSNQDGSNSQEHSENDDSNQDGNNSQQNIEPIRIRESYNQLPYHPEKEISELSEVARQAINYRNETAAILEDVRANDDPDDERTIDILFKLAAEIELAERDLRIEDGVEFR